MAQNFKKQTNQKNKKKDSHNPAKSNHDAFSTERVLRGESQLNLFRYLNSICECAWHCHLPIKAVQFFKINGHKQFENIDSVGIYFVVSLFYFYCTHKHMYGRYSIGIQRCVLFYIWHQKFWLVFFSVNSVIFFLGNVVSLHVFGMRTVRCCSNVLLFVFLNMTFDSDSMSVCQYENHKLKMIFFRRFLFQTQDVLLETCRGTPINVYRVNLMMPTTTTMKNETKETERKLFDLICVSSDLHMIFFSAVFLWDLQRLYTVRTTPYNKDNIMTQNKINLMKFFSELICNNRKKNRCTE